MRVLFVIFFVVRISHLLVRTVDDASPEGGHHRNSERRQNDIEDPNPTRDKNRLENEASEERYPMTSTVRTVNKITEELTLFIEPLS